MSIINWSNYSQNSISVEDDRTIMISATWSDCFALGFDLESYSNADKDKIFVGMVTFN